MSVSAQAIASLATTQFTTAPPEVYTAKFITSLTSAITSGLRPITIHVAATQQAYGQGTFSIAIYDAGTDANPVNFEALEVIGGGASTSWTVITETGWSPITHANGSTVIATVFTPRSIQQPLNNHVTPSATPDPHSIYVRKSSFTAPGQILTGTGSGTFTNLPVGTDGTSPVADSTRTGGIRWANISLTNVLTHMGDMFIGGLLGLVSRLGIGTLGQQLQVVQNPALVATPTTAPTCSAVGSGGSLTNGTTYTFGYAWQTPNASPDGGQTPISATTDFVATTTGIVAVQCPPAPQAGLTLLVYANQQFSTLRLQGTLANASITASNTINVSSINGAAATASSTNTTGGLGPGWRTGFTDPTVLPGDLIARGASSITRIQAPFTAGYALTSGSGFVVPTWQPITVTPVVNVNIGSTVSLTAIAVEQPFGPSGPSHKVGGVPDPGSSAGSTRFLREDATWQVPAGGGNTTVLATATLVATVSMRTSNLPPVFGPSGPAHGVGAVTDPGPSAGSSRFLREDGAWAIPPGSGGSGGGAGALAAIQTQALGTTTASVTFTVPAGFKDIYITYDARGDTAAANVRLGVQLNGDTGANYDWMDNIVAGGTVGGSQGQGVTEADVSFIPANTATANVSGTGTISVMDYLGTTFNKAIEGRGVYKDSTASNTHQVNVDGAGFWRSSSAVTSITLLPQAGNFVAGSTFTLWGETDAALTVTVQSLTIGSTSGLKANALEQVFGPSGVAHAMGNVPDPGSTSGSTRFLREDGTWATPPGTGGGGSGTSGGALVPIQTQTLSGTAASVTFSVPTGFKNLYLTLTAAGDTSALQTILQMQFNGDTGSNYDNLMTQNNTGFSALNETVGGTSISIADIAAATAPANTPGITRIYIQDYANTTFHKAVRSIGGVKLANSSTNIRLNDSTGFWRSTAAITSILLQPAAGNFVSGSTFTLWGEADQITVGSGVNNLIQETILSGTQSSISIPNIPQGYRDLRISFSLRSDTGTAQSVSVQFNGDTGSNYEYQRTEFYANNSSNGSGTTTSLTTSMIPIRISGSGSDTHSFVNGTFFIPDYANTLNYKILSALAWGNFTTVASAGETTFTSGGSWHNTAALTSITISLASGNFVSGSSVRVYGEPSSVSQVNVIPSLTIGATAGLKANALEQVFGASGTTHAIGNVPDPGSTSGATRFLREDATWQTPAGGSGSGTGGSIVPIQTQTPSGTGTVTFTVPTGFKNLRITGQAASTQAATSTVLNIQFNGDTGANYDWDIAYGTNSGPGATGQSSQTSAQIAEIAGSTGLANAGDTFSILIPNHGGTNFFKSALAENTLVRGGTNNAHFVEISHAQWRSTAAITSVTLVLAGGNFATGSTLTLWGEADTAPVLLTSNSNLIQETILTAAQATISVSNIPQGYKDLRVVVDGRSDAAVGFTTLQGQFNGDSGANYGHERSLFNGTANNQTQGLSTTSMFWGEVVGTSAGTAQMHGISTILIPNYTGTTLNKATTFVSGTENAVGSGGMDSTIGGAFWRNTAAITSITLSLASGNFAAGTAVRVYGEPAASAGPSVGTGTRTRLLVPQYVPSNAPTKVQWTTNDQDSNNQHLLNPTPASLTGTIAKTAGSQTLTGTNTSFTTQLAVQQVVSVPSGAVVASASLSAIAGMNQQNNQMPGSTVEADCVMRASAGMDPQSTSELLVVVAIASNTSATVSRGATVTSSGAVGTIINSAIVFPQTGMYDYVFGAYLPSLSSGMVTMQTLLNGTTVIAQNDGGARPQTSGYMVEDMRPFQQWDFIEAVITQTDVAPTFILADERTHFSVLGRPTVTVAVPYVNIQEQQPAGTDGGTFTSGAWRTRLLNTIVNDSSGISSISSNQITLQPGTYRVEAVAQAGPVNENVLRLRNITSSTTLLNGMSCRATSYESAFLSGRFTLTSVTVLELQHNCESTRSTDGFGLSANSRLTGGVPVEIYSTIEIWKEG